MRRKFWGPTDVTNGRGRLTRNRRKGSHQKFESGKNNRMGKAKGGQRPKSTKMQRGVVGGGGEMGLTREKKKNPKKNRYGGEQA